MKTSHILLLASEILAVSAVALPKRGGDAGAANIVVAQGSGGASADIGGAAEEGGTAGDAAGSAAGGEEGAAEGEENEVEQEGQFDTAIDLGGGDIKTDTIFPPGDNGSLEVEFQNPDARTLTVTENATPGNAPVGFDFLEPVSYIIDVQGGTEGLTLQKVDYILTAGNTVDISQGQVGKLCANTNTFVVGAGVGELEFEAEENELSLTVDDMNGEWGIFVPSAAGVAAGGTAGNETEAAAPATTSSVAADGTSGTSSECTTQLCSILQLIGLQ